MKYIYFLLAVIFLCQNSILAMNADDMPQIKFNGSTYSLFYSAKDNDFNGYLNEYFKNDEGYTSWSELIAVHHMSNAFSPIDQAKLFKEHLAGRGCPCIIDINDENNTAIMDFVIIEDKKLPVVIEFNIFKYQKDEICGTVALQYAKRYILNNRLDAINVKKSFFKTRDKYIKKVAKLEVPKLIEAEIDNGKYIKDALPQEESTIVPDSVTYPKTIDKSDID